MLCFRGNWDLRGSDYLFHLFRKEGAIGIPRSFHRRGLTIEDPGHEPEVERHLEQSFLDCLFGFFFHLGHFFHLNNYLFSKKKLGVEPI